MKKNLIILYLLFCVFLTSCNEKSKIPIAMIFSEPNTSIEQDYYLLGIGDAMQEFGDDYNIPVAFYEPQYRYAEAQQEAVKEAIRRGAEIIVFPGELLEQTVFLAQQQYPEVKFVLIDGKPNNGNKENYQEFIADNTCVIKYDESQAGFLAGYAAVMDGFTKLGFWGGKNISPVVRFGYGFAQGAEYAADILELDEAAIDLRYLYCGSFSASPEFQTKASKWYWEGTEVIFACGGAAGQSVIQASKNNENAWVIGVDMDQSQDADTVLTSAVKDVPHSVYEILRQYAEGDFAGGKITYFDVAQGGVGLPMETSRFRQFTKEEYEDIYQILGGSRSGETPTILDESVMIEAIPLRCVNLQFETLY